MTNDNNKEDIPVSISPLLQLNDQEHVHVPLCEDCEVGLGVMYLQSRHICTICAFNYEDYFKGAYTQVPYDPNMCDHGKYVVKRNVGVV